MKKVLSVAMASAMVLGMGANAFAIQYNTGSSDTAEWPDNFKFDGELFVTDKDGKVKKDATTAIEDEETADFAPGDVVWMPLYADDQVVYTYGVNEGVDAEAPVKGVKVAADINVGDITWRAFKDRDGKWKWEDTDGTVKVADDQNPTGTKVKDGTTDASGKYDYYIVRNVTVTPVKDLSLDGTEYAGRKIEANSVRYYIGGTSYKTEKDFKEALAKEGTADNAYITVNVAGVEGKDDVVGGPINKGETVAYGNYTGNIDKDWSINLIEKDGDLSGIVEKAELYRATTKDAEKYNTAVNGVYLKVTLKKEWKSVKEGTVKYYVYISENGTNNKTNEVWVSGTYKNALTKPVSFTWTNNANVPAIWEVKEGSGNGTAVFDYNDKAFFTVKMYEGEKLYLDLGTAYDRAISNEIYDASGAEVEAFYNFITADSNFSRTGELVLVTDDDSLVPYQVDEDGNLVEVDAEYVKGYTIAHTNEKVNGFKFNTKELGNYILSEEIVVEEEETPAEPEAPETETPAEPEAPVVEEKPNPNTGAEDFVGLAVSLAVVSVAAAGALALKK